jgi:hypothetical protein
MPLQPDSQYFPAVWLSGWRRIPTKVAEAKPFLLFLFTAPYAALPQQPIFSGCCGGVADAEYLEKRQKQGPFCSFCWSARQIPSKGPFIAYNALSFITP